MLIRGDGKGGGREVVEVVVVILITMVMKVPQITCLTPLQTSLILQR